MRKCKKLLLKMFDCVLNTPIIQAKHSGSLIRSICEWKGQVFVLFRTKLQFLATYLLVSSNRSDCWKKQFRTLHKEMLFMYWKLTLVFHFLWQERLGKGGGSSLTWLLRPHSYFTYFFFFIYQSPKQMLSSRNQP